MRLWQSWNIGTVVTENVMYTGLQSVVTFIFLIYMLWSPVKMDGSALATEVFDSTTRYLKVKTLISAFTGLSIGILLWGVGLDLPAAFGLLSFLANFLPGIGSFIASVLPCILGIIDVRKTPTQVLVAFIMQMTVHFCIDFVIEPVFFGISVEMNSVIVILGIWFFYEVWGVPGMLLSVPLLAVTRIMLKSMRPQDTEDDAITLVDNVIFAGRFMSTAGDEDMELAENNSGLGSQQVEQGDRFSTVEAPNAPRAPSEFNQDLWKSISESQPATSCVQVYHNYQLLIDLVLLLAMTVVAIVIPL